MAASPITLTPSHGLLKYHFKRYFPTLVEFEQYKELIFLPDIQVPLHNAYLCPLCLKNAFFFIKDDDLYTTSEFDEDHFPPESVGGKNTILVCKPCNSFAGTNFDYAFKETLQHKSYQSGRPNSSLPLRAKISTIEGHYRGSIFIDDTNTPILDIFHNKNTALLNQWIEDSKTNPNYSIELIISKPENETFQKSLLKAAYLYCFEFWGYSFAYSRSGELMRKVLNSEIDYPIKSVSSFEFEDTTVNFPAGVCIITKPIPWRTYAVNIPVLLKDTGYKCVFTVLIPPPTENGWEELAKLGSLLESKPEAELTMWKLVNRYEEFLRDESSTPQKT